MANSGDMYPAIEAWAKAAGDIYSLWESSGDFGATADELDKLIDSARHISDVARALDEEMSKL